MQEDEPDEDAENAGKGGCGLGGNLDVALCRADWHLHKGEYQVAAIICCLDNLRHALLLSSAKQSASALAAGTMQRQALCIVDSSCGTPASRAMAL